MRKYLLIALAALLLTVSFLAACQPAPQEESSKEPAAESSALPAESKDDTQSVVENDSDAGDVSMPAESTDPEPSEQPESSEEPAPSKEPESPAEDSKFPDEPSEEPEVSDEMPAEVQNVRILFCSYSEKPYYAIVGSCTEGAVVTAKSDTYEASAKSWHGWFAVRMKAPDGNGKDKIKISQKYNGKSIGYAVSTEVQIHTQKAGQWPCITGYDTQFFFQKMLPDYTHTNLPSAGALSNLSSRIKTHLEQLRKSKPDADIIYIIAPSAMTTYPELVPEEYVQGTGKSRMDAVQDAIREGGGIVIDLRDTFNAHKNDERPLYFHYDSHWSEYGGYLAYEQLFNYISTKFADAKPHKDNEFDWTGSFYETGDFVMFLDMDQLTVKEYGYLRTPKFEMDKAITSVPRFCSQTRLVYSDNVTYENTIRTGKTNLPSCVVIRDSYCTSMYDIIADNMNTTHYMPMWHYTWNSAVIANEKPDFVIYLVSEWNIDSIMNG